MNQPLPTRAFIVVFLAALAISLALAACSGDASRQAAPDEPSSEEAVLARKLREAKALDLFQQGRVAPVARKVEIFASVIARYPDTSMAPKAYYLLIHNLLDMEIMDQKAALQRTKAFGSRHPEDVNYSECYRQLYHGAKRLDWGQAYVADVASSWGAALEKSLAIADLEPTVRLIFLLEKGRLAHGEGEKKKSLAHYEAAAAVLPVKNKRWELDALVELGGVQAEFKDHHDAARATFARAIKVIESWKSTSYTRQDIEDHMRKLGL